VFRLVRESYEVVDVTYVNIQNGENVYVTWTSDPTSFRVRTYSMFFVLCLSSHLLLILCFLVILSYAVIH